MLLLLRRRSPFFIATLCFLTQCNCSSKPPLRRITQRQIAAVSRIQELSGWSFEISRATIQVRGQGAVELSIEGDASRQSYSDEPLWVPLALMQNPPEYFRAEEGTTAGDVDLEAYGLGNNLWCITAVVKNPSLLFVRVAVPEKDKGSAQSINLKLFLVSRSLTTELPILLPMGRTRKQVDVSVDLPDGGRFSGTTIGATDESGSSSFDLAVLPKTSPDQAATTAAANIHPTNMMIWDFSKVRFSSEPTPRWQPWFAPSALLIVLSSFAAWAWFSRASLVPLRSSIARTEYALTQLLAADEFGDRSRDDQERLSATVRYALRELDDLRSISRHERWSKYSYAAIERLLHSLDSMRYEQDRRPRADSPRWREAYRAASELAEELRFRLKSRPWRTFRLEAARRALFTIVALLAILSLIWLLASLARAQPGLSPRNVAQRSEPALYDMAISVLPNDPNSDSYNSVSLGLTFYGTSDFSSAAATQEVWIEHGGVPDLQIQNVTVQPATLAIWQSGDTLRIRLPRSYAPELRRLTGLAKFGVREFRKTNEYQNSLYAATETAVHYTLSGAQFSRQHTRWSWLHKFPFDEFEVRLPVQFSEPVVLSKVDLRRLSDEYEADPVIRGFNWQFSPTDDGRAYRAAGSAGDFRWIFLPGERIALDATFRRSAFQRYGLTIGLLLVALVVGSLLGWLTTLPDKNWQSQLITVAGVLGLPLAVRAAIFSTYKALPNVLTGQGMTIFDLMFIFDVMVLGLACWATQRRRS